MNNSLPAESSGNSLEILGKNDNISKTFSNTKHKGDPSPSWVFDNKTNVNNS